MRRTINNDIGDPWRCMCPECHSYDVRPIQTGKRKQGSYSFDGNGKKKAQASRNFSTRKDSYRCNNCQKRLTSVYDKKQNEIVSISELLE